jgi:hypothetical protein
MCDYSLHHVASRPARVADKLTTRAFGTGTRGFAASEDARVAVCVLPGTELAFANPVECRTAGLLGWSQENVRSPNGDFSADQQRARGGGTSQMNEISEDSLAQLSRDLHKALLADGGWPRNMPARAHEARRRSATVLREA